MKGYWLAIGTEIADLEAHKEYVRLWSPIAERYKARVNPLKVSPLLKEARDARRVIVVEFPSYEAAKDCYDDPDYVEARQFAIQASGRELLILNGHLE